MPAEAGAPPESRFGERMKEARQQLGLSVEALSRLCKSYDRHEAKGISPPTLGRYESGDTLPSLRELRLLADALAVPVQWLATGDLPSVHGAAQTQALAAALRDFVEMVNGDIPFGGMRLSEGLEWHRAAERARFIAEAKRPG
jgi:transcriptional regulator with XRE-family HTH domain